jgi:hypothetical protein
MTKPGLALTFIGPIDGRVLARPPSASRALVTGDKAEGFVGAIKYAGVKSNVSKGACTVAAEQITRPTKESP